MTTTPRTLTERRRLDAELDRLRGARCTAAAGGCDRVLIQIAELEHRLRQIGKPRRTK